MSTHFVACQGRDLYFFYPSLNEPSNLQYRIWREGRFLPETTLHTGVKPPFTVFHQGGSLRVFCRDANIMLFTCRIDENSEGNWSSRVVLQGSENVLITPIISEDSMCILYNDSADGNTLFKRTMASSGEWQPAEAIDHYRSFPFAAYEAQATGPGHSILFYQNSDEECLAGYREITPKRTGPFHRFLNVNGTLADASFLTTPEEVHLLLVVKTQFSCQLLYRKKTDDTFTDPILLWESPKIEQCLLTIAGDELHATCMIGGKLYWSVSSDFGGTFGSMVVYKRKFCADPVKATFVSENLHSNLQSKDGPRSTASWFARQVYVDRAAPWDIQMIPDLVPNFYPQQKDQPEKSTKIKDLEDNLAAAHKAIEAKDRQIMDLLYQSKKNEDI